MKSVLNVDGKRVLLSPGMAVSLEVKTGKRRFIEYLLSQLLLLATSLLEVAMAEPIKEVGYIYQIEVSRDADMCSHMRRVLNQRFQRLWDVDSIESPNDPAFSADSKFAFKKLPGVEHDVRMTFAMEHSKVPSSAEFDAVPWREGRAIVGGDKRDTASQVQIPILVAHIDFDNDGQKDTLLKWGFSEGYSAMGAGRAFAEYFFVWRGQARQLSNPLNISELLDERGPGRPVSGSAATLFRPFSYKQHTYAAVYTPDLGKDGDAMNSANHRPFKETMSILSYRFTGRRDEYTKRPAWDAQTVCRFNMKQRS